MKKIVFILASIVIVGLSIFFLMRGGKEAPKFKTEQVARRDIKATVTATGTVNAVTTVDVGTQVSGTIKYIYADFNSPVKKNELIAQIDPALFEAQVEKARADVQAARADLKKGEATLVDAKRTMNRERELFSRNLVARSDLDTAETNYETARAQVGSSKAQIKQLSASLNYAETNLKYTRILSPVDGIVVSRKVDVGQTVAASFQTPTLFTIAEDLTKMQIDTNVDEADIGAVAVGQNAEFTVDAYPETPFSGKVAEVRIAPTTIQNVVTYDVVVKVDNPEFKLKPGMTANVSIIVSSKKNILSVPNAALRFMPEQETQRGIHEGNGPRGSNVWVLDRAGKPKRVSVKVGITDGTYSEITSGEIKDGDRVIVESLEKPKDQRPALRMF
ncbi:MAG: efflux RND transporter periplasmic adaptor subunit [Desulfobacteraceae bacterium]|nr:efflux RND transporter periplasmic adaptor subunit [Desulfobacteraceae bacterium]